MLLLGVPLVVQLLYAFVPLPEIWPFSNFRMFSQGGAEPHARSWVLRGVARDDGREVRLDGSPAVAPYHPVLFRKHFRVTDLETRHALLRRVWDHYREGRRLGRHDGPELRALRIYRVRWDWSGGLDAPRIEEERIDELAALD